MKFGVCVPSWNGGDPDRERNLRILEAYYQENFPDAPVHWSQARTVSWGVHDGAETLQRQDCDVMVVTWSDCLVPPAQLTAAVEAAASSGRAVKAFDLFGRLKQEVSPDTWQAAIAVTLTTDNCELPPVPGFALGGVWAIRLEDYFACYGFDARTFGWGGDDTSYEYLTDTVLGRHLRIPGQCAHLWHPAHPYSNVEMEMLNHRLAGMYEQRLGDGEALMRIRAGAQHWTVYAAELAAWEAEEHEPGDWWHPLRNFDWPTGYTYAHANSATEEPEKTNDATR